VLAVTIVLLVVAAVAIVVLAVRVARLGRAVRAAEAALAEARAAGDAAEARAGEARAEADGLRRDLDALQERLERTEAEHRSALEAVEAARAAARAAEADARAAHAVMRGAQADAEAARRRALAAEEAAAGHPGWAEVLGQLEALRGARTWRSIAPTGELPGAGDPAADTLSRGLEVELQWMRDVVGTPGRLVAADGDAPSGPPGPAALVALLATQEVLDVVGKRVETLDVRYVRGEGGITIEVTAPEAEHPVDPEDRLARLSDTLAPLGGSVVNEPVEGPGVAVRLDVPVARLDQADDAPGSRS